MNVMKRLEERKRLSFGIKVKRKLKIGNEEKCIFGKANKFVNIKQDVCVERRSWNSNMN